MEWSSWHHRKGLGLLEGASGRRLVPAPAAARRRNLRIAALFSLGSVCFALGSLPPLAEALRDHAALVFFVGSLFFSAAAALQFHEAANAGPDPEGLARTRRLARFRGESTGWWATAVQLVGTLAFNVSTFAAVLALPTRGEVALVWAPDVFGSLCFLVASALALNEVCRWFVCWEPASAEWQVAVLNLVGSVAFGVSAVAARIVLSTGEVANASLVNATTFVGAACFLVGAVLLPRAVRGAA